VHYAQVPDRRSLADLGDGVGAAVQDRSVLDIRSPSHDDRPEVGPQHSPIPDGRLGLHAHVPDQGGGGSNPRLGADIRLMALKCEQWHSLIMHERLPRRRGACRPTGGLPAASLPGCRSEPASLDKEGNSPKVFSRDRFPCPQLPQSGSSYTHDREEIFPGVNFSSYTHKKLTLKNKSSRSCELVDGFS
jgi:hypothetical protein